MCFHIIIILPHIIFILPTTVMYVIYVCGYESRYLLHLTPHPGCLYLILIGVY